MKNIALVSLLTMLGLSAHAATYECNGKSKSGTHAHVQLAMKKSAITGDSLSQDTAISRCVRGILRNVVSGT